MPKTEPMSAEVNMIRVAQCPICHANTYCCIVAVFTDPRYECLRESEEKAIKEYCEAGYEIKDIPHATAGACDCYTPNGYKKLIAQRDRAAQRQIGREEVREHYDLACKIFGERYADVVVEAKRVIAICPTHAELRKALRELDEGR